MVTPDEVEEYIGGLRERFASLKTADRPVEDGDYTSIDLSASVDGEPVEDAQASGLSYEVGSGTLLDGLDEALLGMSAGESTTFSTELAGGEHGGEQADVTVTVHSVKIKELPELDDEFAQSASEFDTLGELRAGTRTQLEAVKRMQQARQARDRALDAVLAKIDIPLPDALVQSEIDARRANLDEQLERAGATREAYLQSSGQTEQQLEADMAEGARKSVKAGFVLDQLAQNEDLNVEQDELNAYVIEQAYRMGVQPDRLAQEITEHGQIGSVVADVLRGKSLNLITERVTVTDDAGKPVDVSAALRPDTAEGEAEAEEEAAAEADTPRLRQRRRPKPGRRRGTRGRGGPAADADGADQDETATKTAGRRPPGRPPRSNRWRAACADSEQAAAPGRSGPRRGLSSQSMTQDMTEESRVGTPPAFEDPTGILARTAEAAPPLITEQIFQRLLRHRIIFLGQQVDEDIANRMCAEMVLLASEDASGTSASTSTRRAARCTPGWPSTT